VKTDVGYKESTAISVALLVILAILVSLIYQFHNHNTNMVVLPIQFQKVNAISDLESGINAEMLAIRGYMLYQDESYLRDFREKARQNRKMEEQLLAAIREERKPLVRRLIALNEEYDTLCEENVIPHILLGQTELAVRAVTEDNNGRGKVLIGEMSQLVNQIIDLRRNDTFSLIESLLSTTTYTLPTIITLTVLLLALGISSFTLFARRIWHSNNIYRLILATTRNATISCDEQGRITNFNRAAEGIFDITATHAVGKKFGQVFTGRQAAGEVAATFPLDRVLASGEGECNIETNYQGKDEWRYSLTVDCLPFEKLRGRTSGALMIARDMTEMKVIEENLRGMGMKDGLTLLHNHVYLKEKLKQHFNESVKTHLPLTFMLIDIDNFRYCNERFGYTYGDEILKITGNLLKKNLRNIDTIGRYGSDEFGVVLFNTDSEQAATLANQLRDTLKKHPFPNKEQLPFGKLTFSAGIASIPEHAENLEQLIKMADDALYQAKRSSRNRVEIYFSALSEFQKEIGESDKQLLDIAKLLLTLINAKDRYTYGHTEQVMVFSWLMAKQLNLPKAQIRAIRLAALLHDIGKIDIGQEVLNKNGALSEDEWEQIRQHPKWGANILRPFKDLQEIVPLVLHHHERYNGKGYPFGLQGEDIPLGARIITVADSFDAMTTNRPYKRAMNSEEAVEELRKEAGKQFDPAIVEAFLDIYKNDQSFPLFRRVS